MKCEKIVNIVVVSKGAARLRGAGPRAARRARRASARARETKRRARPRAARRARRASVRARAGRETRRRETTAATSGRGYIGEGARRRGSLEMSAALRRRRPVGIDRERWPARRWSPVGRDRACHLHSAGDDADFTMGNYLDKNSRSLRRRERRPSCTHSTAAPVLGPRAATPGGGGEFRPLG